MAENAGIRAGIQRETLDACWAAIDAFPSLKDAFQRKFRTSAELEYLERRKVSVADIGAKCAVALHLASMTLTGRTNIGLNWPIAVRVTTYHSLSDYHGGLDMIEEVVRAIFGARAPGGTATFVQLATCGPPQQVTSLGISNQNVGILVWVAEATFVFGAKTDPYYQAGG